MLKTAPGQRRDTSAAQRSSFTSMNTLRNPLLWITCLVMLTLSLFAQDTTPTEPLPLAQSIEAFVIGLAIKHPWIASALLLLGTLRLIIKPLMSLIRLVTKSTSTPADDQFLDKVEASWLWTAFLFIVDWLTSIKLPAAKARPSTSPPARGRAWLFLFCLLPFALLIGGCGTVGQVDTTYNPDGSVGASTTLTINSNANVVAGGTYNPANGNWTASVSIVFKDEISAAIATTELAKYNLGPAPYTRSGLVWRIEKFDFKNPYHITVLEVAQKAGATWSNR